MLRKNLVVKRTNMEPKLHCMLNAQTNSISSGVLYKQLWQSVYVNVRMCDTKKCKLQGLLVGSVVCGWFGFPNPLAFKWGGAYVLVCFASAMFFQGKWLLLESWNFKTYCRFPIGSLLKKAYLYWLKILRQTLLKFVDSSPLFDIWLPRLDLLLAYPSQHQFGNHLDFIQRPDPPNRLQHRQRSMKTVTYTHPEWWLDQKKLPTYLHIPSHRPTYLP